MGGSAGGSQKTSTNTDTGPWKNQVPYLKYGFDEAARLYQQNGPQYYKGSTVAGFSPEQLQAFGLGTQRALNGSQDINNARGYTNDVLAGKYLNSDPYKDQVFSNVKEQVLPAVNAQFMGSGRYGSDLHAGTVTQELTNSYAPYASAQYQAGLDRMNWAAGMAPTWAANDYMDLSALEAIGQQRQGLAQNELNDAVSRWDYYNQLPYNKLGQFLNNIGGNYGGTVVGTTKSPNQNVPWWQQAAGGGLSLLGGLGGLGWKPFG